MTRHEFLALVAGSPLAILLGKQVEDDFTYEDLLTTTHPEWESNSVDAVMEKDLLRVYNGYLYKHTGMSFHGIPLYADYDLGEEENA